MRHTIQVEYGQPESINSLIHLRRSLNLFRTNQPLHSPDHSHLHLPSRNKYNRKRNLAGRLFLDPVLLYPPRVLQCHLPPKSSRRSSLSIQRARQRPQVLKPRGFTLARVPVPCRVRVRVHPKRANTSEVFPWTRWASERFLAHPLPRSYSPTQAARSPSEGSASTLYTTISKISGSTSRRPSTLQVTSSPTGSPTIEASSTQTSLLSPDNGKKNRRSTLSVMVEPIARSIKVRTGRSSTRDPETPSREKDRSREPSDRQPRPALPTSISEKEPVLGDKVPRAADSGGHVLPASTSKARKVMQWFRSRSKGRGLDDESEPPLPMGGKPSVRDAFPVSANISSASVNAVPTYPSDVEYTNVPSRMGPPHPQRTASTGTEGAPPAAPSFAELVRRHVAPPKGVIRTHHGAVSQATVTTGVPIEVMRHVRDVLVRMGVEVQVESDYKYRCVRTKRRRAPPTPSGLGLGLREWGWGSQREHRAGTRGVYADRVRGIQRSACFRRYLCKVVVVDGHAPDAASCARVLLQVDKRGLPIPSQSTFGGATGGMLKGLLMRRQSSQVSSSGIADPEASSPEITPSPILPRCLGGSLARRRTWRPNPCTATRARTRATKCGSTSS
jgi:protein-serine/threonine kinase